jgi:hypothetical protein
LIPGLQQLTGKIFKTQALYRASSPMRALFRSLHDDAFIRLWIARSDVTSERQKDKLKGSLEKTPSE